ncbi:MAG: NACHT domain-containing protein [Chloroflexota bacterium]
MTDGIRWWLETLQQLFGNEIVAWIVTFLSPFALLFVLLWLLRGIIEIIRTTFIPLFYNVEQKRRIRRRQRFADHVESGIRRLNQREDWSDFRFAELEAEVEMEGKRKAVSFFPFIKRTSSGLRREKSLSKALKQSRERIILLEGDAGSGKSVALRHVALDIANDAIKSKSTTSLIPIYLNLKELRREQNQPINRSLIENFVLRSLKRINDRDVDKFIDDEFQRGLENGSWLFLFDSFDEIPEILGAEDADNIIREYADAIYDFLHGLNACRGVVASRYFKGPGQVGWPRFRVVNLTRPRQIRLIRLSELTAYHEKLLLGHLDIASSEIQRFATNPLFLGLLIGYVQSNSDFPQNADVAFGAYIQRRLNQDKDRVAHSFGVTVEEIRRAAEQVAFCMSRSQDLGLSPTRDDLKKSLLELKLDVESGDTFEKCLDALEYIKLARSDTAEFSEGQRTFTFAHRRFQEYFATTYVLSEGNITAQELLTNPRWRETAVVICQTQPLEYVSPIVEEARALLDSHWENIKSYLKPVISSQGQELPIDFPWPDGCLYLLDLLQDGFSSRRDMFPEEMRKNIGVIVSLATLLGSLPSRIWALEVAGIAPDSDLLTIIRPAIADGSHFLSDIAYRQVARLENIPDDIKAWIKQSIFKKLLNLGIFRGDSVVFAQVSRLVNAKDYLAVVRGIQFGYLLDLSSATITSGALFLSAVVSPLANKQYAGVVTFGVLMMFFGVFVLLATIFITDRHSYFMNRLMVGGISYPLLFFALYISGYTLYPLIALFYMSLIMPSLITSVKEFPFEKSIIYVLFSPFVAFKKISKNLVTRQFVITDRNTAGPRKVEHWSNSFG